jgi:hypothetical protein
MLLSNVASEAWKEMTKIFIYAFFKLGKSWVIPIPAVPVTNGQPVMAEDIVY